MKHVISTTTAPGAVGPYSQAIEANGFVFVSGQLPLDPASGACVGSTAAAQLSQSLTNVRAILNAAGLGLEHIVKTTLFIKDLSAFNAINEVYASFFTAPFPARSCVEVARLPKDALVEIEVIAAR